MSTKHVTALATAALAAVLLAGCASGGSGSGNGGSGDGGSGSAGSSSSSAPKAESQSQTQSKDEACTAFESRVKSAAEGLQTEVTKLQSDPDAAVARLKELDTSIGDGVDAVSEPTVKAKAEAFQTAYSDMVTRLEGIAKDPKSADLSAFQESATAVQTAGKDFDTTCAS